MLIKDNGQVALASAPFCKLSFAALGKVLDMDSIKANEIYIFQACMTWAWAETARQAHDRTAENARSALDEHLYKIRFTTMKLEEFANQVIPTGILTPDEGYTIFQQFVSTTKPDKFPFPMTYRLGFPRNMIFMGNFIYG